jgi:NAD(P)-dependent dehydrogenase (short-subunit alcohol dehydrogenase family)
MIEPQIRRFSGKRILITGASSGIGRSCALKLSEEGAELILVGRNESTLTIADAEHRVRVFTADLTSEIAVKETFSRIKKEVGSLNGVVLAAGLHAFRPLSMEGYADLASLFSINVQGSLGVVALLLRHRLLARGSSVIFFSSAASSKGSPGAVAYAASKGALEASTRSLALELASQQIRVNAVAPGVVRTPMSEAMLGKLTADQIESLEARHPLGFGIPEDVAGAVVFLLSEEARWITGVVMPVDGGFRLG